MPEEATSAEGVGSTPSGGEGMKLKGPHVFLLVVAVIGIGLFLWSEMNRRQALQQLSQTRQELEQLQAGSTEQSGEALANEVLGKVRSLMDLPTEPQPTVATIVDVEKLKQTNPFFEQAKNGDHLILTDDRAILYDSVRNVIIDVAPFQLQLPSPSPTPRAQRAQPTQQP